MKDFILFFV